MHSRRVQSSITELKKGINNCELLVTKFANDRVVKSESNTLKCDASSTRERSVMRNSRPIIRDKSSLSTSRLNSQKPNNENRLLCKEVFQNNNATVEVTVKAKTSSFDRNRKRHRSNTFLPVAETDGASREEQMKQSSNLRGPPALSKVNRKGHIGDPIKKVLSTKNKSLSWDRILKDSKTPCVIHDSKSKKFPRKSKLLRKADPVTSTDSIENSSSSDHEPVHYRSRSVQCCLPKDAIKYEANPPTERPKSSDAANDGGSIFSVYDPVRTLQFFIKELNSKIKNCDKDDNLKRIIADMEKALTRISSESTSQEFKENINIPVKDASKPTNLGFVPLNPVAPSQLKNVLIQKTEFPEQKSRDIPQKQISLSPPRKPFENVKDESQSHVLLGQLEVKCNKLESSLNQLGEKYEKQRKERESLTEQINHLKEELKSVNSREKDYLTTIGYLKSNLQTMAQRTEQQAKSISELTTNNSKLKEENKTLGMLRERETVIGKHLKESSEKETKFHTELQIMKLEQEKFHILLAGKNSEIQKLKQELRDIQSFVVNQLSNFKSHVSSLESKKVLDKSFGPGKKPAEDSDVESEEAPLLKGGRENDKPICSSPTSSTLSSSGINSSWQKISRISSSSENDIKKCPQEVVILSPPKTRKFKKSDDGIDLADNRKSFPLMKKPNGLDFRSFLLESQSETLIESPRQVSKVTEPKSCQEFKDDLRDFFNKIKREASKGLGVSLPSPPHHFSEMSEPGGMSQWSEVSDVESFISINNTEQR